MNKPIPASPAQQKNDWAHIERKCPYCHAVSTIANGAEPPVYIEWKCWKCKSYVSDDLIPDESQAPDEEFHE